MSENDRHRPFSERNGFAPPPALQINSMNKDLRTCLWNALRRSVFDSFSTGTGRRTLEGVTKHFCFRLWADFFTRPDNQFPFGGISDSFESSLQNIEWYRVYDLIEFILDECDTLVKAKIYPAKSISLRARSFCEACENCLIKHNSAYRICGRKVVPITSKQERAEINSAMNSEHPSPRGHIYRALCHLSNRENPDYPNCIKESISAVESLAKIVTGKEKATLGKLTRELGELHPAFRQALGKLYGYTSDAQGIRHGAFKNPAQIRQEDARFMLVVCSAFVNYIEAKRRD